MQKQHMMTQFPYLLLSKAYLPLHIDLLCDALRLHGRVRALDHLRELTNPLLHHVPHLRELSLLLLAVIRHRAIVLGFKMLIYEGGQVKSLAGFAQNVTVNRIKLTPIRRSINLLCRSISKACSFN